MKMKYLRCLIIFISLFLSYGVVAQEQVDSVAQDTIVQQIPYAERINRDISRLLESDFLKSSQLGLMVYDLDADSVLFAHNAKQTLRPASTMKVLTAITALDFLGEKYRFTTRVSRSGQINGRRLDGNIYVRGGMDPTFSEYDMRDIVEAIRQLNVDTICGALVADRSFKDDDMLGEGWCWDDKNPELTPLIYKRNDGFMSMLRTKLDESGIAILGCDSVGRTPAGITPITQVTTELGVVLQKMMKDSDNLYAESMYYQLGAKSGSVSTAKRSQQYERQLIQKMGLNADDYRLADGSGLSLYNYVTAELEVAFLRYAYKNRNVFYSLYHSLPIAGFDGTLKKRMTSGPATGNVHAKTGTVTGVSSLAGYVSSPEQHTLAFCIINQGVLKSKAAKDFQDAVCEALCR